MSLKESFRKACGGATRPKCQFLKPEDVVTGVFYAFTYNPEHQPSRQSPTGVKEWWRCIINNFEGYDYCSLKLYLEISSQGRLHFHGYIMIKDIPKFYYDTVPDMVKHASIEMDTIKDTEVWEKYCRKQEEFIQPWIYEELYNGDVYPIPEFKNTDYTIIESV